MYYNGNNALNYETLNADNQKKRLSTPKKTTKKPINKAKAIGRLAVLFLCFFITVLMNVQVSVANSKVGKLQRELNTIEAVNQVARVELDKNLDLSKIESIAITKLGMKRPERYQTIYISLNQGDYTEKVIKKENKTGIIATILGGIDNIAGIFGGK